MEVLEKEIRSKEEIMREVKLLKVGVSGTEERLNELTLKLDKLKDELAEVEELEEKKKAWKPQEKELYWCITDNGDVNCFEWGDDETDNWNYSTNNCFKTKEEAERKKFELLLENKARLFQLENNEEIDWEDKDKAKFYIYYNIQSKTICLSSLYRAKTANKLGYFSSYELADQFVNENKKVLIEYFEGMK